MSALTNGIKHLPAPSWTDDPQARIAVALETLAGCTGWLDEYGRRQHDGDTCPVHEGGDLDDEVAADEPQTLLDRFRDWAWHHFGI